MVDIDTKRIHDANNIMCVMLGYSHNELIRLTVDDILPREEHGIMPDDFSRLKGESDEAFSVRESPVIRKNGTVIYADIKGVWLNIGGKKYLSGFFRDVTKRINTEKLLQQIHEDLERRVDERTAEVQKINNDLEAEISERKHTAGRLTLFSGAVEFAMDGIQIVGLDGRVIYSNKAAEKILGYEPGDSVGKFVSEVNVDTEIAEQTIIPRIKKTGYWEGELLVRHPENRIFPIWLCTSLVKDNSGAPVAMVGVIRDITERKQTEDALRESQKLVETIIELTPT